MGRKNKKMYGGFFDSIGSTLSGWGTTLSDNAKMAYYKTKNAVGSATSSYTGAQQPTQLYSVGGRTRRRKRSARGGASLASNSSPVHNVKTAQPHNWVGGKSKKHRKHKHSKTCSHRKH